MVCFGCFDLPITEVLQDLHLGILGDRVYNAGNIYYQDGILPSSIKIKSKYSLENVTRSDYRKLASLVNKMFVDMFGNSSVVNDTRGI